MSSKGFPKHVVKSRNKKAVVDIMFFERMKEEIGVFATYVILVVLSDLDYLSYLDDLLWTKK